MVKVPSARIYIINADLLSTYSGYFRRKIHKLEIEHQALRIEMEAEATHAENGVSLVFVRWLHQQDGYCHGTRFIDINHMWYSGWDDEDLIKCWLFGQYIEAPLFQNAVIEAMTARSLDDSTSVANLWNLTPRRSKLRQFLVQLFCRHVSMKVPEKWNESMELLPQAMKLPVYANMLIGMMDYDVEGFSYLEGGILEFNTSYHHV